MSHKSIIIQRDLIIESIDFIHFYRSANDFNMEEKPADCLEIIFVDKGRISISSSSANYTLQKDEFLLIDAGYPHRIYDHGLIFSDFAVLRFVCPSVSIYDLKNTVYTLQPTERIEMHAILKESGNAFWPQPDTSDCRMLTRKEPELIPFGSEQLILSYLLQLLIRLYRRRLSVNPQEPIPKSVHQQETEEQFYKIISYMEENIHSVLTLDDLCRHSLMGRSALNHMFQKNTGYSVMSYFSVMKINAAKQMIKNTQLTFSQISDSLNFSSIHYFSRHFKALTGITPSAYAATVRSKQPPAK